MRRLLFLLLPGCPAPAPPPPPVYSTSYACTSRPQYVPACGEAKATASMTLGTQEGAVFTALDPDLDEPLPLHPGPQGGYHAYLNVRTEDVCDSWVLATVRLREPGETSVLRLQQFEQGLLRVPGTVATFESGQLQMFICPSQLQGVPLGGRTLELEVSLVECGDTRATAPNVTRTYRVVPTCPDGDRTCAEDARAGCAAP